jgi:hypothetical protein
VMTTVLPSSDSVPLSSDTICWNTFATTVNMSFRDELFASGAWSGWLRTCWLCLKGGGAGYFCCCVLLRSAAAKDSHGVVWLEVNTLAVVVSGALCDFLFRISSLACPQPLQLEEWGSSPSTNLQSQHVRIDAVLPFSAHRSRIAYLYNGEGACS